MAPGASLSRPWAQGSQRGQPDVSRVCLCPMGSCGPPAGVEVLPLGSPQDCGNSVTGWRQHCHQGRCAPGAREGHPASPGEEQGRPQLTFRASLCRLPRVLQGPCPQPEDESRQSHLAHRSPE